MTGDESLARAAKRDFRTAELDARTRLLLEFAVALTRDPAAMDRSAIDRLRDGGWDDAQILTATQVVGFFNYYVRLVEALGVEPEPEMERDPEIWPD